MNIVTGYTGTPHVTSNAAQAFNAGIFGVGEYVLAVPNTFSATLTDANTVTIGNGEGVMQGVHFRIDPGTVETVNIDNGTSGKNRIDLICARYTKDAVTGIEAVSLAVIKGTETTGAPVEPSYNQGMILTGGSPIDFPMYKVTLTGLTPVLSAMFKVADLKGIGPIDVAHIAQVGTLTPGSWEPWTSSGGYYSVFAQSSSGYGVTAAMNSAANFNSTTWASVSALANDAAVTEWVYIPAGTTFYTYSKIVNNGAGNAYLRLAMPLS